MRIRAELLKETATHIVYQMVQSPSSPHSHLPEKNDRSGSNTEICVLRNFSCEARVCHLFSNK